MTALVSTIMKKKTYDIKKKKHFIISPTLYLSCYALN